MYTNMSSYISIKEDIITNSVMQYKIDSLTKDISENKISVARKNSLTVSLLNISKKNRDPHHLSDLAKCISSWETQNPFYMLRGKILDIYQKENDIEKIYLCQENDIASFIVIMDDSTSDNVFRYNELGFELSEQYPEIEDFMIIDTDEASGCEGLLENYNLIYKRG